MNYNHVTLVGRLAQDPEITELKQGEQLRCSFTLSVDRPYKNSAGKSEADFLRVVTWNKLAEVCGSYLSKGKLVLVEGNIETRKYEKEGQMHYITEIAAGSIKFLESVKEKN
jgi:single-strand DNA-binding protein